MCKILNRIKNIADNEGITIAALERSIGASKGVVYKAISKGTDIQAKWIEAIAENYPQYSTQWLLTGVGDMLNSNEKTSIAHTVPQVNRTIHNETDIETRPRIPFEAAAGSLSLVIGSVHQNDCEHIPVIPTFPRYDFTIVTRGDSMLPDFHSGDELACAFVKESSFIQWGRVHVLDTAQGIVLKKIFDGKKNIVCKSINKEYPDFEVPKDEIYHIAIVVGLIRHF